MSHQRGHSTAEAIKNPHNVSLKVLRLARPSLADQFPIPSSSPQTLPIPPSASLSYPSAPSADTTSTPFIISPTLLLPSSFGTAYVGETFACTLCANNELPPGATTRISGIRISAEIQTPAHPSGIGLSLQGSGETAHPGESVQRVLKYELSEEGEHVLAVTVTYSETLVRGGEEGGGGASGGRVRTFRKLYQFVAAQLLNVRTKAGDLPGVKEGKTGRERERYALEAQLENMGHAALSLEAVTVNTNPTFKAISLNWDFPGAPPLSSQTQHNPILNPRDVIQVAFLIEELPADEQQDGSAVGVVVPSLPPGDKRTVLGQLAINWRSTVGDRGSLRTAWLTNRR